MLDPKEEKRFEELRGMCRELKVIAPPEIMIGLQVHEGGVLTFDDKQRGHSWTRNGYNAIFAMVSQCGGDASGVFAAGKMSAKNVFAGTIRSTAPANSINVAYFDQSGGTLSIGYNGGIVNLTGASTENYGVIHGIVCGTGSTAFSAEHFALAARINHGNSAGQLYHTASAVASPAYAAPIWTTTHKKIFNNNSGGSITVAEVGLYSTGRLFTSSGVISSEAYMIERSVLAPAVAVADGAQLTVTYEISMDFSAID
jgi:hypothetical protein